MPASKRQWSLFITWWTIITGLVSWTSARLFSESKNSAEYKEEHVQEPHQSCY